MKLKLLRYNSVILLLLFGVLTSMAGSVKLTQSTGRGKRQIEVGDLFYIEVTVSDMSATPEMPTSLPGAKVMYFEHTGKSSSMTIVNGKTSQTSSNTWTLTAKAQKEGSYTYGPIVVGGVKSNSISYSIGKAQAATTPAQGGSTQQVDPTGQSSDKPKYIGKGDGNLFLQANVSQTTVYEQQALVYTVKLYTTYDAIKFIGATAAPKFDGFVVEESKDVSKSLSVETYNGKSYATAIIARYVIFPQMTGQLKISGNTYTVSVDEREYYHDPFWGSMSYSTPLQLNVKPNDLSITVKSLPTPKPADFSGGVGKFTLSSQLKSNQFKSNQAASIVYTVTGTGNLKYVQMPDLAALYPNQLEIYTPKTDLKTQVGSSNVTGSVSFDYSFMPLEEGSFKIPEIKLVYFNPETGTYETTTATGYDITVGKGVASAKSQARKSNKFDPTLQSVNLNKLSKEHSLYIYSYLYWILFFLPLAVLALSTLLYKNYLKEHSDMVAFNSKRANKLARRRLKKAYANMKKQDVDGFYDELLIALWGYMGDKLKMPTSELMRDNIKQVLEQKQISEEVITRFVELLDTCEFAKYSPESGKNGMQGVYDSSISIINELEESFKKVKSDEI